MFQRLKGAIDSRIAEEQARQRQTTSSPSRSESKSRRPSSRASSPVKKGAILTSQERQHEDAGAKGPDPAEFDPAHVLGNDEVNRPGISDTSKTQDGALDEKFNQDALLSERNLEVQDGRSQAHQSRPSTDLSTDVRVKLRKLEKLELKYHDLLKSYRVAHARIQLIEPFEISLRENTPLTSIGDPRALSEYLNQISLKGDMVLDELKRVSTERDAFKQRLGEAERNTKAAWDEVANLKGMQEGRSAATSERERTNDSGDDHSSDDLNMTSGRSLEVTNNVPPGTIKSPPTTPRMSLFSPKAKNTGNSKDYQPSEDLFSFDQEIPRRETELHTKQDRIKGLEFEVMSLKGDLAVTRESTQSMVQTLEEATLEVNALREAKDRSEEDNHRQQESLSNVSSQLRGKLREAEEKIEHVLAESRSRESTRISHLAAQLQESQKELERVHSASEHLSDETNRIQELQQKTSQLDSELAESRVNSQQSNKKITTLNNLVTSLRAQLEAIRAQNEDLSSKARQPGNQKLVVAAAADLGERYAETEETCNAESKSTSRSSLKDTQSLTEGPSNTQEPVAMPKKKNKKKKKVSRSTIDQNNLGQTTTEEIPARAASKPTDPAGSNTIEQLQRELERMRALLNEKDEAINKVSSKLKDQDGLREEIDSLRDDLINIGQDHVEAKDKVKEMTTEKSAFEATIRNLEKELAGLKGANDADKASSKQAQNDLTSQFEYLRLKVSTLQTDLSAAQQLAQSRFKDLNDLRSNLQKAQPEINSLRQEAVEAKTAKEMLGKRDAEFKRLESRHEEMRSQMAELKRGLTSRDSEIVNTNKMLNQEHGERLHAEDASIKMTQEMQHMDTERRQAMDSLDKLSKELSKAQEGLASHKARLREIEQQFSKCKNDKEGLQEDMDLKAAQYASAQSLMSSMRNQTAEMAIQVKEARDRCESLDEEVAEAHRLLGERSKEGETMRRLLADVEGRADARMREMKERMDTAIDERDRAEDEASTLGRRRAREVEDMRNDYRDMERNLKRAEEYKEELELSQRDWKRRREELEHREGQSLHQIEEIRTAMTELRDALDESEKQARELEKQKAEFQRSAEETQYRLEKVQKSNKSMADEIGKIQIARSKSKDQEASSSPPSLDSSSRISSPANQSRQPSAALAGGPNGQTPGAMDYTYLKNVLLQFLEQKDKKHQFQLIPVLGMLLHFDRKDEQKWIAAIK